MTTQGLTLPNSDLDSACLEFFIFQSHFGKVGTHKNYQKNNYQNLKSECLAEYVVFAIFKLIPATPLLPTHPPISPVVAADLDVPYRQSIQHTFRTVSTVSTVNENGRTPHNIFRIPMHEYREINPHQSYFYE